MDQDMLVKKAREEWNTHAHHLRHFNYFFHDPRLKRDFTLTYLYLRRLDDIADESDDMDVAEIKLDEESRKFDRLLQEKDLQVEDFEDEILMHLHKSYGGKIERQFQRYIGAFRTDISMRRDAVPLPQERLWRRNVEMTVPCLNCMKILISGKELSYAPSLERLMQTWIRYDFLRDVKKDLYNNINLFSREELENNGLDWHKDIFDQPGFMRFYSGQKRLTISSIYREASLIHQTDLATPLKYCIQSYFMTRAVKLALTPSPF